MTHYDDIVAPQRKPNWRDDAACRSVDPDLFFPRVGEATHAVAEAQAICRRCPVRAECADTAIKLGEYWGVWGGMTQTQLRTRSRQYRAAA
ncbi:WhiB family transcriptional regulator [Streptomyces sp. NPDC053367]|uniref:WhiB family transcriptional regulator n=1 Tax=Streptomyces sp. NPDC053367 TaxID=3365700 RepID=UPI0037D4BD6D